MQQVVQISGQKKRDGWQGNDRHIDAHVRHGATELLYVPLIDKYPFPRATAKQNTPDKINPSLLCSSGVHVRLPKRVLRQG